MDAFILSIDGDLFRSTNAAWNYLMLNDPWSVGYVSSLIESKEWQTKEEWENFYYQSGETRKKLLGSQAPILEDFSLVRTNPSKVKYLPWETKNMNTMYGRTREDLQKKADVLREYMLTKHISLTEEEAFECVRFRTICETWNGIIIREQNTINTLQKLFSQLSFIKSDGEKDHSYAVDYEIFKNGKLICAIQIKPKTYLSKVPYVQKARYANLHKYESYFQRYGVPVFEIISTSKGEILNSEVISEIKTMC